jgi:fructosamine-3-kinase
MLLPSIQAKLLPRFPSEANLSFSPVSGGSINNSFLIDASGSRYFCKINSATKFPQLFQKEAQGLELLGKNSTLAVPGVIDCFEAEEYQVLLLEWIDEGERDQNFWKKFGEGLSRLHRCEGYAFGLDHDNYMGSLPQANATSDSWIHFFRERRLEPLVELCMDEGLLTNRERRQFESLYPKLREIFDDDQKPVLLHGDRKFHVQ